MPLCDKTLAAGVRRGGGGEEQPPGKHGSQPEGPATNMEPREWKEDEARCQISKGTE
jgi:hypothetical protein